MCTVLNADCFFSIVLSHTKQITFDKLFDIRNSIQNEKFRIVINLSGASIYQATTYYPCFFVFENSNSICRGNQLEKDHSLKFIKEEFSNEVSESVLDQVNELVSKSMAG